MVLYVPRELSFISNQFFVLNLDGWFGVLCNKFAILRYSIIVLLNYYIDLNLSIIYCLSSGYIYLSFCIYVSLPSVSEVFLVFFCNFISIFSPIKSSVASAVFWITRFEILFLKYCFFEAVLSVTDCLAWSRIFWLNLLLKFCTYVSTNDFIHVFIKRQKSLTFYKYLIPWLNWIASPFHILHFD